MRSQECFIRKEYAFSAGHWLPNVPEEHPCKRVHGHNYKIEIFVAGLIGEHSGWVADFAEIDRHMGPLVSKVDHQMLNDFLENPTAELLALWFLEELRSCFPEIKVRVWETPKAYAETSWSISPCLKTPPAT